MGGAALKAKGGKKADEPIDDGIRLHIAAPQGFDDGAFALREKRQRQQSRS